MIETQPSNNVVHPKFYETKKLVQKLGLAHETIYCCMKGCMLFYKGARFDKGCRICSLPWYKEWRIG